MNSEKTELKLICMEDVETKEVEWLWYPYIPYGKITVIEGDPGEGKTTLVLKLAALLSRGEPLPCDDDIPYDPINIIYQTAEDGIDDTIKPRLEKAGADCSKIRIIDESEKELTMNGERLEQAIAETKAKLIILDPIQAYLGASVDMHRANEIRPVMKRLGLMAEKHHCAVILIGHMNKASGAKSTYRGLGSIDIQATARSVLLVARIKEKGNIHQHLDLIAGLPYEDIKSFRKSFDDVYSMRPDQLQLGFLKVLKGSYMQEMQQEYELRYKDEPPYEVLSTKWLPYSDVIELKGIEEMVEIYYNSGQFTHVVEALVENYASAYQMYQDLWQYYEEHDYMGIQHRRSARYEIVLDFVKEKYPEQADVMRELLTYDYYLRENAKSRPEFAGEDATDKRFVRAFYEEEEKERKHLPGYEQFDRNQMRKMTHLEYFPHMGKMLLFDYKFRNPLNQEARTCMIKKDSLERRG